MNKMVVQNGGRFVEGDMKLKNQLTKIAKVASEAIKNTGGIGKDFNRQFSTKIHENNE